jgi:hypothetical protein
MFIGEVRQARLRQRAPRLGVVEADLVSHASIGSGIPGANENGRWSSIPRSATLRSPSAAPVHS